ncbi:MAG: phosphoethanolamine transferase CptA [Planctomycetia bacterium]|nr:phosphoethanolamine transferase CptA [Planctomycetia bacterium]
MADGRDQSGGFDYRTALPWTNIFRCFQVAIDPRKLFVAAVGILVMSFFWWLLSHIFWEKAPTRDDPDFGPAALQSHFEGKINPATGKAYTNEELSVAMKTEGDHRFKVAKEQWQVLDSLAGEGGRFRTLPWYEYRGPNPFLLFTDVLGGTSEDRYKAIYGFGTGSVPVLIEPLVKLLLPVAKLVSPSVSPLTRLYLFLILLVNVAVWAFCGGIITRLAAVQLANKGPITLRQAFQFVWSRYLSYLGAPLVPLVIIGVVVLGLILYGAVALFPFVGDIILFGVALPLVFLGGAIMAVFLVGLIGYPMMYPTLSAEGDQSDTFDALSRSVNYVYQAPWQYLWNWTVAIIYGALVTLFVLFFASLTVYVGKWAVGLPSSAVWSERKPEFLFIYAPESFGWKELLTKDSPYAVQGEWVWIDQNGKETDQSKGVRQMMVYKPVNKEMFEQNRKEYWLYNTWGAGIVCFWLTLAFLMMLGFSYSFFWTASTMIYFIMRKKVDEAELDEVFEDEEPEIPLAPPKIADGTVPAPVSPTSLPVIAPPVSQPQPPPSPPTPATIPFSPPPVASSPPPPSLPPPVSPPLPPPPEPPATESKKPDDTIPLG